MAGAAAGSPITVPTITLDGQAERAPPLKASGTSMWSFAAAGAGHQPPFRALA